MKAMAKDRHLRYGTADALAADVSRYLNNEPVTARPPSRIYQLTKLVRRNRVTFAAGTLVILSLVLGLGVSTWMFYRANRAREAAELARANEVVLRKKAEIGKDVAHAAVLLKYNKIEEADALLAGIPPDSVQPSLESAETFRALGLWHAREGRWKDAGNRFAALAYSITGVDESDSDQISLNLLPAAAALCEAGDLVGYENLRHMAVERFGDTSNPVVAEQVIKACLILPADLEVLAKLEPFEELMLAAHAKARTQTTLERNLAAWREFVIAFIEFRKGNRDYALEWIAKCTIHTDENRARDAMAWTLRAMIRMRQGQTEGGREDLESARRIVSERFGPPTRIFENSEPQWQDWVNARILLREADAALGK